MIIHLESVSSTMDAARALIPQKPEDGTAVYADYQEQGVSERGKPAGHLPFQDRVNSLSSLQFSPLCRLCHCKVP